jgi:hypothetical protein
MDFYDHFLCCKSVRFDEYDILQFVAQIYKKSLKTGKVPGELVTEFTGPIGPKAAMDL